MPTSDYNFGITSVASALSMAKKLESTGLRAYDGAIAHLEPASLLTAGATVEARHASYLNVLNRAVPFPTAFDKAVAPRKICEAIQAQNGGPIADSPEPYGPYKSLEVLCMRLPKRPTLYAFGR